MNTDLLSKVRDHIVLHPGQHDQDIWLSSEASCVQDVVVDCNTSACACGWVLLLSDGELRFRTDYSPTPLIAWNGIVLDDYCVVDDCEGWVRAGAAALDLPLRVAKELFSVGVETSDVIKAIDYLLEHPDEGPSTQADVVRTMYDVARDKLAAYHVARGELAAAAWAGR